MMFVAVYVPETRRKHRERKNEEGRCYVSVQGLQWVDVLRLFPKRTRKSKTLVVAPSSKVSWKEQGSWLLRFDWF